MIVFVAKSSKAVVFAIGCAFLVSSCSSYKFKSLPWPTSVTVHDKEAVDFLRGAPLVDDQLGDGLAYKDMDEDQKLVGLSISGGGARAAAFALGAMAELQTITFPDRTSALDRIDFMSSNSGGGWGVATYLLERSKASDFDNYSIAANKNTINKAFVKLSAGKIKCWSSALAKLPNGGSTFGTVYSPARTDKLPRAYFNASLFPAQAPFVFTDKVMDYYEVSGFDDCAAKSTNSISNLAALPVTYAASASGAVPAFYHAYATTNLCEGEENTTSASFCHPKLKGKERKFLRIADGGLYDNIGYKTAFEVMYSQRKNPAYSKKAMIAINANYVTDYKTVNGKQVKNHFLKTSALNGVFAVQDSTFERLYRPMFKSLSVDKPVLLDFYSTAKFQKSQIQLLDGLDSLTFKAANNVNCFNGGDYMEYKNKKFPVNLPVAKDSAQLLLDKGGDCFSENFYRAGALGKTSYLIERSMFNVLWELGQLSVRMKKAEIRAAVE